MAKDQIVRLSFHMQQNIRKLIFLPVLFFLQFLKIINYENLFVHLRNVWRYVKRNVRGMLGEYSASPRVLHASDLFS